MMPRRGLTFVELLVAATIFAILAMGLSAHLRGGIDVWRRVTSTMASTQSRRVIADRLRVELANGVAVSTKQMTNPSEAAKPVFQTKTLGFVTAMSAQGSESSLRRLRYVRYNLNGHELERTECSFQEAAADRCGQSHVIAKGVKEFSLRYAYREAEGSANLIWRESWLDVDHLPHLVETTLSLEDDPGQVLSQWVTIPQGQWQTPEQAKPSAAVAAPAH